MSSGLCGAVACNVVVKVKWCCTCSLQSTTSSGVDWADCWWIAVQQQWVHTLWGMFAIRPTSETDGLLTWHTGGQGHPGSLKQIGVHKYMAGLAELQRFHQSSCVCVRACALFSPSGAGQGILNLHFTVQKQGVYFNYDNYKVISLFSVNCSSLKLHTRFFSFQSVDWLISPWTTMICFNQTTRK